MDRFEVTHNRSNLVVRNATPNYVTAYQIADVVNNNPFHTVKYPEDYFWLRLGEIEKLIEATKISVLAMFAYQGPPSKHWLDTQGKYYEGWNDAIDHILELLKKREVGV